MKTKHLFTTIAVVLSTVIATSCSNQSSDALAPSHFGFKESKSDKWGLLDVNGKVIVADEYKKAPTLAYDGMYYVQNEDGTYQLYNVKDPTKSLNDDKFLHVASFGGDLTPVVRKNGPIEYINKKGESILSLSNDYTTATSFINGYSIAVKKTEEEWKYATSVIDGKGQIHNSSKYTIVQAFVNNRFIATNANSDDDKLYIINLKDEVVAELKDVKFSSVSTFAPYMIVKDSDNMYGLVSSDGEYVVKPKYKGMLFTNEYVLFGDEEVGIMNFNGEVIIKPKYNNIKDCYNGMFIAKKDKGDDWGLVSINDERLLKYEYETLSFIYNTNYLVAQKNGEKNYSIIKKDGELINKNAEYYDLTTSFSPVTVESDLYDVEEFVEELLNPGTLKSENLFGCAGLGPSKVCDMLSISMNYYDIIHEKQLEWIKYKYDYSFKFGTLKYTMGFNKVAESYFDSYSYETKYSFSDKGKCKALKIVASSLNTRTKDHLDQIRDEMEQALQNLGYSKDTNEDNTFVDDKVILNYEIADEEVTFYVFKK